MDRAMLLDLVDAVSRAHNATSIARAALVALSRHARVTSVAIAIGDKQYVAGDPNVSRKTRSFPLVDVGRVPARLAIEIDDDRDGEVISAVIAGALRQAAAIARIADVSRRAHARTRDLDEQLREQLPSSIVATAPATRRLFTEVVPLVARQPTSVLILGATGTGKEVVARRIHELSPRAKRPFVRINCGAIPAELVESTLFGHERGAFTGAVNRHLGVIERAHQGTLLLDEVGELPLPAQAKLLRVLESGEVQRVGGDRTMTFDVRVIAATHRDLHARVRERAFREDLLYRLDVFTIRLPPLRERPGDIAPLARMILEELGQRLRQPVPKLDRRALERLREYPWPGNVRELRNVLERSMILRTSDHFELDLPSAPRATAAVRSFDDGARQTIEAALSAARGRVYGPGGAAELLGLKPTTLVSKMKKLKLQRASASHR